MNRLQITWRKATEEDKLADDSTIFPITHIATYELIFHVPKFDMRNNGHNETHVLIGETRVAMGRGPVFEDGTIDTPFRDGVHIRGDAIELKLPAFVVFEDNSYQIA